MAKQGFGRNEKKGGNPSTELYVLRHLDAISKAVTKLDSGDASEATLIAVLNAILAANSSKDFEILLVRDTGDSDVIVRQITDFSTGTTTYEKIDGAAHVAVGPLEYLDASAVLSVILTELQGQGTTMDGLALEATLQKLEDRLSGGFIPETYDYIALTYVAAGNGLGEIETAVYKAGGAGGAIVGTLTLAYDANNNISSVTQS